MISFSVETGEIKRSDLEVTGRMAEEYFQTKKDPEQIPVTEENRDWIVSNILDCLSIIRDENIIIGYSFIIPSNRKLMKQFISGKINEKEMFEKIKKLNLYDDIDAIYLAASFIKEDYRGKGLAQKARKMAIVNLMNKLSRKPTLYFWGYSDEGRRSCYKTAEELKLKIFERK